MGEPSTDAGKKALAAAVLATLVGVFAMHCAYAALGRYPVPAVHDEFAYLLAADTYASGRLTNPAHAYSEHFETFHVLQAPTYQAKYPPGQGMFLALGQRLFGHPVFGVWLSLALAAAASCWMLAGALPIGWALAVPWLFLVGAAPFLNWGQSYWGGGVAMLGGALFFGGLVRLRAGAAARVSWVPWVAGLGALLLANTRPLEGLVAAAASLPVWWIGLRRRGEHPPRALLAPLALTLAVILAWTGYYNWRVTGDPLRLPYNLWNAQASPQSEFHAYAGSEELSVLGKLRRWQMFFLGSVLVLSLPFLLLRWKRASVRSALLVVGATGLVSLVWTKAWPHYLGPVTCLILLLLAEALRGLAGVRLAGMRVGLLAVGLLSLTHVGLGLEHRWRTLRREPQASWHFERQAILQRLEAEPGLHLVLVRYPPGRSLHREWVYNRADIDGAKVVWARDLGERNAALLGWAAERRLWRVVPPDDPTLPVVIEEIH